MNAVTVFNPKVCSSCGRPKAHSAYYPNADVCKTCQGRKFS